MAIEQLGESLLSNVRQRNDQIARENRKRERKDAIMAIGTKLAVGVGNQMLADRTADFLNNEQYLASATKYKQAAAFKADIESTRNKITNSGSSDLQYFMDVMDPEFKTQYNLKLTDEQREYDIGSSAYEMQYQEALKNIAQERLDVFRNAEKIVSTIRSPEDVTALNAAAIQKARPDNVGDLITRGIQNLFGDNLNQKERDQRALDAIMRNDPNRDRAIAIAKEWEATQNLPFAVDKTNANITFNREGRIRKEIDHEVRISGDNAYVVTTEKEVDILKKIPDRPISKPKVELLFSGTKEQQNDKILKALTTNFNFAKDSEDILTVEAFNRFTIEAIKQHNVNVFNIQTLDQYNKASQLLLDFANQEINLRDKVAETRINSLLQMILRDNIKISADVKLDDPDSILQQLKEVSILGDNFRNQQIQTKDSDYKLGIVTAMIDGKEQTVKAEYQIVPNPAYDPNDPTNTEPEIITQIIRVLDFTP